MMNENESKNPNRIRAVTVGASEHRRVREMSVALDRPVTELIAGFINRAYDNFKLAERIRTQQRMIQNEKRFKGQ